MKPNLHDVPLYCIIDKKVIPPERAVRKANTCSPECKKKANAIRRAQVDRRRCRHCHKPSTPEDRTRFKKWTQAEQGGTPKRGRRKKESQAEETVTA